MTDDQYKAGLEELLIVFENLETAVNEEEYYEWYDYGQTLIEDALQKLDKRVLH
jgi:hypothetical protein